MSDDLLPDLLAAIEQQLVSPQTTYVARTLQRLITAGLAESEAKTQIACQRLEFAGLGGQLGDLILGGDHWRRHRHGRSSEACARGQRGRSQDKQITHFRHPIAILTRD